MDFSDKWASYYAGEKTILQLTLKRQGTIFSKTILDKKNRGV